LGWGRRSSNCEGHSFERLAETSDPATDWAQFKEITQDSEQPLECYFEKKKRAFDVGVRRNQEGAKVRHFELIQYAVSWIKHAAVKGKAMELEAEDPPIAWIAFMTKVRGFRIGQGHCSSWSE